jgi:ABC-2 type transport system ATP-binding protein
MYRLTVREASHWARSTRARATSTSRSPCRAWREAARRARTLVGGGARLDFALALVGDPSYLPRRADHGLRPAARAAGWDTPRSLRDLGKTVLLTTHYLDEAQALADRVAIVKDGASSPGRARELGGAGPARAVSWRAADGTLHERETEDPTTLLHRLTGAALERGEVLEDLSVSRPTLEDVYLELTAGALVEEAVA